jgi:hypothetical protein
LVDTLAGILRLPFGLYGVGTLWGVQSTSWMVPTILQRQC